MVTGLSRLQERLSEALFQLVAGPDGKAAQDRIHGTPGPRWFSRDSAIAHVHSDTSVYIGGLRALMMQSLHPVAMWAVAEHSGYRGDMWGRLARTSTFLAATTFGAATDAEQAVATVNRIHEHVRGTMPDGTALVGRIPHSSAVGEGTIRTEGLTPGSGGRRMPPRSNRNSRLPHYTCDRRLPTRWGIQSALSTSSSRTWTTGCGAFLRPSALVTTDSFRIGASSLVDDVVARLRELDADPADGVG